MKLYRYMSIEEFLKLNSGAELNRYSEEFENQLQDENNVGFCFLGEKTMYDNELYTPIECLSFLEGIVSTDVLVEFETTNDSEILSRSATYSGRNSGNTDITEYFTQSYSKKSLIPTRYLLIPKLYSEYANGYTLANLKELKADPSRSSPDWQEYFDNEFDKCHYYEWEKYENLPNTDIKGFLNLLLSSHFKQNPTDSIRLEDLNVLRYLPTPDNSHTDNIWSLKYDRYTDQPQSLTLLCGNPITNEFLYKLCLRYDKETDIYILDPPQTPIPDAWKNISDNPIDISSFDMAKSYLIYAALVATYPKINDFFGVPQSMMNDSFFAHKELYIISPDSENFYRIPISGLRMALKNGELDILCDYIARKEPYDHKKFDILLDGDPAEVCNVSLFDIIQKPPKTNVSAITKSLQGTGLFTNNTNVTTSSVLSTVASIEAPILSSTQNINLHSDPEVAD